MPLYFWITAGFLAIVVLPFAAMLIYTRKIAEKEYYEKLVRTSPEKWGRQNSCPENEEHSRMYEEGMAWAKAHAACMKPESIESCGFRLKGEYYDFGSKNCVIIIPGRAESLNYSYFFAPPYERAGFNILVIDTRAHGLSEGKFVGMGIGEIPDVTAWARFLKAEKGMSRIVLHGICIGASTSVMASVREDCPGLAGIISEGLFKSFYTIFKQRTKNGGHPAFPFMWHIYRLAKKNAGVDIKRQSPESIMGKMSAPVLFLHSKKDNAALPKYAQQLFAACSSSKKKLVWFEEGAHSHIRIADKQKYDDEICAFLAEI